MPSMERISAKWTTWIHWRNATSAKCQLRRRFYVPWARHSTQSASAVPPASNPWMASRSRWTRRIAPIASTATMNGFRHVVLPAWKWLHRRGMKRRWPEWLPWIEAIIWTGNVQMGILPLIFGLFSVINVRIAALNWTPKSKVKAATRWNPIFFGKHFLFNFPKLNLFNFQQKLQFETTQVPEMTMMTTKNCPTLPPNSQTLLCHRWRKRWPQNKFSIYKIRCPLPLLSHLYFSLGPIF